MDISIYIKAIPDPHQRRIIENLHYVSGLGISNWQSQMLYPYTHQFVLYDDIRESLTGIGRFMQFRCYCKNNFGEYDPTHDADISNWIMEIKEGEFDQGEASGYQR